jgi:predicted nuclease with TOPRIM domain
MSNLTAQDCLKKLEAVEKKLEELRTRRLDLLKKNDKDDAEKAELADYAKLEADKVKWNERLDKAQGIV